MGASTGGAMRAADVQITRPTKLLWPEAEVTKQVYADYLDAVGDQMLPCYAAGR